MQSWSENISLSEFTSIKLGGPARYFYDCKSRSELPELIAEARSKNIPFYILGGGSNTLFSDEGFEGLIIKISFDDLREISALDSRMVAVEAGYDWDTFVKWSIENSCVGIEAMSGIPGSVGGTPIQNVGAYGQEVSDVLQKVEVYDTKLSKFVFFEGDECEFSYRMSRFKGRDFGRYIVTTVFFNFIEAKIKIGYPELEREIENSAPDFEALPLKKQLWGIRAAVLKLRKSKSMVLDPDDQNSQSLGSFFTNPVLSQSDFKTFNEKSEEYELKSPCPHYPVANGVKLSAAWLVENSGFPKGYRYKGVGVSEHHSLALVNRRGTTAELLDLADQIRRAVLDKFGVLILQEPVLVGGRGG